MVSDTDTPKSSQCVFEDFLQQESFIGHPQQDLPFLRLLIEPMTATMTSPVTAMIAMIDDVFIILPVL
jgi:hypothetical protein